MDSAITCVSEKGLCVHKILGRLGVTINGTIANFEDGASPMES